MADDLRAYVRSEEEVGGGVEGGAKGVDFRGRVGRIQGQKADKIRQ